MGFPRVWWVKNLSANTEARDLGFDPWMGKDSGVETQPTPLFLSGDNPRYGRSHAGQVHRTKESTRLSN